jgi:hypothetical protein
VRIASQKQGDGQLPTQSPDDIATRKVAEAIRQACQDAAIAAYEDAGIRGLCAEGRWECAVQAIRGLDLMPFLTEPTKEKAEAEPLPPP